MTPATTVVLALAAAAIGQSSDTPSTAAERLCKGYETISSITCSIRKTTSGPEGRITLLSRVFYEKPDRVHIENVAPQKRRIIADGSKLYYHEDGRKKGYAESIPRLSDTFRNALRNQPATPLEHLRKLRSLTEDELDGNDRFATRKGYQADKLYIVLSLDREGRLGRITFYESAKMQKRTAQYEYDRFEQVSDDCWIPCLHRGTLYLPGDRTVTETRRVDELSVNTPVAKGLFDPGTFFEGVEFVDDLMKTYE